MGSYGPAYSYKLQRILSRSGINLVSNPLVNLHLQGRFDGYPKRRGLTQVKELLGAGVNVAFGSDDLMDPWYPLGTANPIQVALVGAEATQLTAPAEVAECFRMVTDRAAGVLGLGDAYGIEAGRPASFVLLPASGAFDAIRRQVAPSHVVAHGRVVAQTPPRVTRLEWPGHEPEDVDFVRRSEQAGATWRRTGVSQ
jgi:cytosine deaminase